MTDRKYLPRDPSPEMVEAMCRSAVIVEFDADLASHMRAAAIRAYHAAHDAAPTSLPLKRTEPPTEPGWYWIRWGESEAGDAFPAMVYRDGARLLCSATNPPCPVDQLQFFGRLPDGEVEP